MDPKQQDKERISGLLVKAGDERKKVAGNLRGLVSLLQEDMAEHSETILFSLVEWYVVDLDLPHFCLVSSICQQNRVFTALCWDCLIQVIVFLFPNVWVLW